MSHSAKLYSGDDGQIVYLPSEYRFNSTQVFIRKDTRTGEVILSEKPQTWDGFFAALEGLDVPDNFLDLEERKLMIHEPDPFADMDE